MIDRTCKVSLEKLICTLWHQNKDLRNNSATISYSSTVYNTLTTKYVHVVSTRQHPCSKDPSAPMYMCSKHPCSPQSIITRTIESRLWLDCLRTLVVFTVLHVCLLLFFSYNATHKLYNVSVYWSFSSTYNLSDVLCMHYKTSDTLYTYVLEKGQ